jgi:hypothetical protein
MTGLRIGIGMVITAQLLEIDFVEHDQKTENFRRRPIRADGRWYPSSGFPAWNFYQW